MLQISLRIAGAVLAATAALAPSQTRAADLPLVIRLYDMATGDSAGRAVAMRAAGAAIASAGASVTWRDCSRGGAAHPCRTVRDAGDLVVRIMPARGGAGDDGAAQLGYAPIDPSGRATVIATVYYDAVLRVAQRTGLGVSELLGRAMAHEIGHLLLREPGHAPTGLMRPLWTDDELMQNRPGDWTFSDADRRQVQAVARESAGRETIADPGDAEAIGR